MATKIEQLLSSRDLEMQQLGLVLLKETAKDNNEILVTLRCHLAKGSVVEGSTKEDIKIVEWIAWLQRPMMDVPFIKDPTRLLKLTPIDPRTGKFVFPLPTI